jgi:hypothetical protein
VPCSLVKSATVSREIIALIMEAVSTSETSLNFYRIERRSIPEESSFHTRPRENLKKIPISFYFRNRGSTPERRNLFSSPVRPNSFWG